MDFLKGFLAENGHIQFATPESPDFAELCAVFVLNETRKPSMIVRPRSADQVGALVSVLTTNDLPFTIRAGGHDMFGRCQVDGAVTIDMREFTHVHVDTESHTARVGGGVISINLVKELAKFKMVVPHPVTPTVGFVGWALYGGYGMLSSKYGLGVDQILGATVIDAQGVVREADETMLTAIRGAGGIVGVIAELKIRIYPLDQVLAGAIIYQPTDLGATIQNFNDQLRESKKHGLPPALALYQLVNNSPVGKTLTVLFMWASSDLEEGQSWLSKVSSWAPVAVNAVIPTTLTAFNDIADSLVPKKVFGSIYAATFYSLTPEVVNVISKHAPLQPNSPDVMYGIHELRDGAPCLETGSVFYSRRPHVILEIIPISQSPDTVDEVVRWAQRFHLELSQTDPANIPPFCYISLTPSRGLDMKAIYGSKHENIKAIKKQYDPLNKFNNALVQP
ncbi:hypothetical protein N7507_005345 [Penicillium longicatenatum]|nr:hypothetical protein N7507_005345 [Penicillium longicatenatum]